METHVARPTAHPFSGNEDQFIGANIGQDETKDTCVTKQQNPVYVSPFPQTRDVLWCRDAMGAKEYLRENEVSVIGTASVLSLLHNQVLLQQSAPTTITPYLIAGGWSHDGGLAVKMNRFDPGMRDANGNESTLLHVANDKPIPVEIVSEITPTANFTPSEFEKICDDLHAYRCSNAPIHPESLMHWSATCKCTEQTLEIRWDAIIPCADLALSPIAPVPLLQTGVSRKLSGETSGALLPAKQPEYGYVTFDTTRNAVLLPSDDPQIQTRPISGIWISGVADIRSPFVWSYCQRFMHANAVKDRAILRDSFLVVLFPLARRGPFFFECTPQEDPQNRDFKYLTAIQRRSMPAVGSQEDLFNVKLQEVTRRPYDMPNLPTEDGQPQLAPRPSPHPRSVLQRTDNKRKVFAAPVFEEAVADLATRDEAPSTQQDSQNLSVEELLKQMAELKRQLEYATRNQAQLHGDKEKPSIFVTGSPKAMRAKSSPRSRHGSTLTPLYRNQKVFMEPVANIYPSPTDDSRPGRKALGIWNHQSAQSKTDISAPSRVAEWALTNQLDDSRPPSETSALHIDLHSYISEDSGMPDVMDHSAEEPVDRCSSIVFMKEKVERFLSPGMPSGAASDVSSIKRVKTSYVEEMRSPRSVQDGRVCRPKPITSSPASSVARSINPHIPAISRAPVVNGNNVCRPAVGISSPAVVKSRSRKRALSCPVPVREHELSRHLGSLWKSVGDQASQGNLEDGVSTNFVLQTSSAPVSPARQATVTHPECRITGLCKPNLTNLRHSQPRELPVPSSRVEEPDVEMLDDESVDKKAEEIMKQYMRKHDLPTMYEYDNSSSDCESEGSLLSADEDFDPHNILDIGHLKSIPKLT